MNLLPLEKGESISAVIATKDFPAEEFLMFATAQGNVKKTSMDQYDRTRRDGLIAINLKDGDELISVKRVAKGEKVIMVSSAGKAILWDESEARAMGRGTMGVRGMNVPADAHVLGMEIAKPALTCSSSPKRATASARRSRNTPSIIAAARASTPLR